MAASIAKLAIQITTDTSKMAAGLRQAQAQVKASAASFDSIGSGIGGPFAAFAAGGAAMAAVQGFKDGCKVAAQMVKVLVRHATELQDRMVEVGLLAKQDTLSHQFKEFGEILGAYVLPHAKALVSALKIVNEQLASFTGADKTLKLIRDQEKLAEAAKKKAEADKKAAEEAARAMEKLMGEGRQLTESLRTPGERMADQVANLQRLFQAGAIGAETVQRAAKQIAVEMKGANEEAKKFKELTKPNVAALERGSTAEFSARQEAIFAVKQQAEIQKQELAEAKRQTALLQRQNDEVRRVVDAVLNQPQLAKGRF